MSFIVLYSFSNAHIYLDLKINYAPPQRLGCSIISLSLFSFFSFFFCGQPLLIRIYAHTIRRLNMQYITLGAVCFKVSMANSKVALTFGLFYSLGRLEIEPWCLPFTKFGSSTQTQTWTVGLVLESWYDLITFI